MSAQLPDAEDVWLAGVDPGEWAQFLEARRAVAAAVRGDEFLIYWAEQPATLPFVRVTTDFVSSRTRYPLNRWRGHNYRVVGHALLSNAAEPVYPRRWVVRVFTVRDYDATPEHGGFIPHEAVDPLTLAPNVEGQITERCSVGAFPKPPRARRRVPA